MPPLSAGCFARLSMTESRSEEHFRDSHFSFPMKDLRPMTLPAIWNMSFGFFGIQFGWGLEKANKSGI